MGRKLDRAARDREVLEHGVPFVGSSPRTVSTKRNWYDLKLARNGTIG